MSKTRRTLGSLLVACALLAGGALGLAGPAAAVTITQSTIDGAHPRDMGCRADQKVIYHTLIKDSGGTTWGYVDLMASTYCHAVWAHIHGVRVVVNQTYVPQGYVHRNSDGANSPRCYAGEGTQDCYTTMLWDRYVTSYAYGAIDPNGATNTVYWAKTPSY